MYWYITYVVSTQYHPRGTSAEAIATDVEGAIRDGRLQPGDRLPAVRALAARLGLSPGTVAAAYQRLADRGLLQGQGRRGTVVAGRPPLPVRPRFVLPAGVRNLADGNPDPALLPDLTPVLATLDPAPALYGDSAKLPDLVSAAAQQLDADGIPPGPLAVVGGAMDGVERVLTAHLRPGDRVVVEDPGYAGVLDLLPALGFQAVPVPVDGAGVVPGALEQALAAGASAAVVTPRAHNPTGAAFDAARARALRRVLSHHRGVLVVEDDHAGPVAGVAHHSICGGLRCWAVVRSYAKSLGPDLRVAVLRGDPTTVARVEGRQALGTGWVSHLLQQTVARLLTDPATGRLLERASGRYARNRRGLVDALAAQGLTTTGLSGLNMWVPVPEEQSTVRALQAAGWAVAAGEPYRRRAGAGIRITISTLAPDESRLLAADLAAAGSPAGRTRTA
jgi:DNA-binding transcriptional MocR family regulator